VDRGAEGTQDPRLIAGRPELGQLFDQIEHVVPAGRVGEPEELANVVTGVGGNLTAVTGEAGNLADLGLLADRIAADGRRVDVLYASAGTGVSPARWVQPVD
jgi:NAD(P)-dependent dehydrogenase (short-subunit alcohol dehydrogenase family)